MPDAERTWAQQVRTALLDRRSGVGHALPEERHQFYMEVVQRHLGQVPASERAGCLRALEDLFPAWEAKSDGSLTDAQLLEELVRRLQAMSEAQRQQIRDVLVEAGVASRPKAALSDAELLDEFIKRVRAMSAGQKEQLGSKLAGEGVKAKVEGSGPVRFPKELMQGFRLQEDSPLEADRMMTLLRLATEFLSEISQVGSNIWEILDQLSAGVWERDDFRVTVAPALMAGAKPDTWSKAQDHLKKKRDLVRALIRATAGASRTFDGNVSFLFNPDLIETTVLNSSARRPPDPRFYAECWRKYAELCQDFPPARREELFKEAIAKTVKDSLPRLFPQ